MAEQAVLLALALLGAWRLTVVGLPLSASIVAVTLAHMAVISQLRFVVPVMPLTMTLGAAGLLALGGRRTRPPGTPKP
jgi:hypothetical protein